MINIRGNPDRDLPGRIIAQHRAREEDGRPGVVLWYDYSGDRRGTIGLVLRECH